MTDLTIKDLFRNTADYANKEVTLEGWVRTVRDSKTFGFIELNDGSFFKNVQIVFNNNLSNFDEIAKLTISSSIQVTGTLVITENAKQPFEIQANKIIVENLCDTDYPLQKKRHSFEYLRTIAHLRPEFYQIHSRKLTQSCRVVFLTDAIIIAVALLRTLLFAIPSSRFFSKKC